MSIFASGMARVDGRIMHLNDKILIAAAHEKLPEDLLAQLKPGGRLVMPLGSAESQQLTVATKDDAGGIQKREIIPVRFTRLETII